MAKRVRVTLELPESFVRLLQAKAQLAGWTKWATVEEPPPEMDAGSIVAWLILMEARGAREAEINAATPMMWRGSDGPDLIHGERKVSVR